MGPTLRLVEAVLRTAGDHLDLVLHVDTERITKVQQPRHSVDQRQHVGGETRLHRRVLVELVEYHLGVGITLQFDDQSDDTLGRLVADIAHAFDAAFVHEFGDLLTDHFGRGLVRKFGDDDALRALVVFDLGDRALLHRTPARHVELVDTRATEDRGPGREVGALHELHEVTDVGIRVVDEMHRRVDHFAQVVRRNVRGHTDRDPADTVHQQIRKSCRQYDGLLVTAVVGRDHVDGVFVDLAQQAHRQRCQPCFGVTHRGRPVGRVGGPEVAVPVDQWVPQRKVLCHTCQRVVDRGVAVGVELAHDVAHGRGALLVRSVGTQAGLVHAEQDAAMDGLESVARVGQCPRRDDGHRVVEEGSLHLLLDADRFDVAAGHLLNVAAVAVGHGCSLRW